MSSKETRGLEFYKTPPEATWSLLALEDDFMPLRIWEPACGDGAISKILRERGRDVMSTDIVDRGYGIGGVDFLKVRSPQGVKIKRYGWAKVMTDDASLGIVTNPPFSLAQEFVDKAFSFENVTYVALLLRLSWLESSKRKVWFEARPPSRIHVSSRRLPMMHREGYEGTKSTSTLAHAWYVWTRDFSEPPVISWFDWRDHVPAEAA